MYFNLILSVVLHIFIISQTFVVKSRIFPLIILFQTLLLTLFIFDIEITTITNAGSLLRKKFVVMNVEYRQSVRYCGVTDYWQRMK